MIYAPGDVLQPGWQDDREAGWHAGVAMAKYWRNKTSVAGGDPTYRVRRITRSEALARSRNGELGLGASPHCRALYLAYARSL